MFGWIRLEAGAVDNGVIRHKGVQRFSGGSAQQVANEQVVPSQFVDHTNINGVSWVGASGEILNKILAAFHVREHVSV